MAPRGSTAPSVLLMKQTAFAANGWARWTDDEIAQIMAEETSDVELSKKLGRSIKSIQIKRHRTNKAPGR